MAKLFCGGIPYRATEDDVASWFEEAGVPVSNPVIPTDRETGKSRGFAFVEVDQEHLNAALDLNGQEMGGRQLTINEARAKTGGGRR